MTDKQIIIDGVDVNGCIYYQYNMCTATKDNYGDCSFCCQDYDMNDCYYKQLKRKNQELEELQETIDDFITDNNSLYSDDGKQPSNLDELQECMQSSMNEFVKYKQTLDKIEKLAKENVELLEGYHLEQANCLTILEIINQAKDGE